MRGMRLQVLSVVPARETRSAPADADKLVPNSLDISTFAHLNRKTAILVPTAF
jgi:hypothetical protein